MALSRKDLFGYAGASHEPQGRVLTAEEEYGAHGYGALNSSSLFAEEAYGALSSPDLFSEEEYVNDIGLNSSFADDDDDDDDDIDDDEFGFDEDEDEDDFGALNSPSLFAEEEYGDDDDDDDDYGYASDDEYGADSLEGELDALDAELDSEIFGAWYGVAGGVLAAPEGVSNAAVGALAKALDVGAFLPSFLQNTGVDPGYIESGIESLRQLFEPGDTREIATYLMTQHQEAFANWNSLSEGQQAQLIKEAVTASAIPGVEMSWDEPFRRQFAANPGIMGAAWSSLAASPSAVWNLLFTDLPNAMLYAATEVPVLGAAIEAGQRAAGAATADEFFNMTAIRYYFLGLVYPKIYTWLAQSVTKQGQAAIQAVANVTQPEGPPPRMAIIQDVSPLPEMLPPPQTLSQPTTGLPSSETILAVGFGLTAAGAVLGVFK